MSDLLVRLSSRKFLLAVGAAAAFFRVGRYDEALYAVLGYVLAEGGIDAAQVVKSVRDGAAQADAG